MERRTKKRGEEQLENLRKKGDMQGNKEVSTYARKEVNMRQDEVRNERRM